MIALVEEMGFRMRMSAAQMVTFVRKARTKEAGTGAVDKWNGEQARTAPRPAAATCGWSRRSCAAVVCNNIAQISNPDLKSSAIYIL